MTSIKVGVLEAHEVFRRGLLACLGEDPSFVATELHEPITANVVVDVIVTSSKVAGRATPSLPLIVCYATEAEATQLSGRADVYALLPRGSVTPEQLGLAVRAAAAGLRINSDLPMQPHVINDRSRQVLRMLASGAGTREISGELGYSERTIKSVIADVQTVLGTRNRTHAVAEAVRSHLI